MTIHEIKKMQEDVEAVLPEGAIVVGNVSLMRRPKQGANGMFEYFPISCEESPSVCKPSDIKAIVPTAANNVMVWFGSVGDSSGERTRFSWNTDSVIDMYVWFNSARFIGAFCDIQECLVNTVLGAIITDKRLLIKSFNVDYSLSALRALTIYSDVSYFPYSFFSIRFHIGSSVDYACTICELEIKEPC